MKMSNTMRTDVKRIVMYEAYGQMYNTYEKAAEYAELCERVNDFMSLLPERTKGVENCTDFLEHDLSTLNKVFDEFLICCREVFPDCADKLNRDKHFSFISRLIDDRSSVYPILSNALFRFQCIDFASGYEYQQPYFARNSMEFFNKYYKKYD